MTNVARDSKGAFYNEKRVTYLRRHKTTKCFCTQYQSSKYKTKTKENWKQFHFTDRDFNTPFSAADQLKNRYSSR